jgi:5'-nucleotidase
MSGAVQARPIGPLAADCLNGAARKGEPGVGPMSREGLGADFHYVAGTPVMALLYGLDIVANARWGKAPDLVLSGPNEGQNLGLVTLNSGTVGIVQASAVRGIPAIALSAGDNTKDNPGLANPLSSKVAQYSVELVEQILGGDRSRRKVAPVLRPGLALNVNFPDKLDNARWSVTRMGTYTPLQFKFVPDLGADPTAKGLGLGEFRLPGLSFDRRSSGPKRGEENDEGWRNRDSITVSVMQAGFGAGPVDYRALTRALSPLTRR